MLQMRLIDADKMKAIAREDCKDCTINGSVYCKRECFINNICDYLDAQPTAEERPQGKWEEPFESNGKTYHKCNYCHISSELILIDNFCPNCGADMKGGAK